MDKRHLYSNLWLGGIVGNLNKYRLSEIVEQINEKMLFRGKSWCIFWIVMVLFLFEAHSWNINNAFGDQEVEGKFSLNF